MRSSFFRKTRAHAAPACMRHQVIISTCQVRRLECLSSVTSSTLWARILCCQAYQKVVRVAALRLAAMLSICLLDRASRTFSTLPCPSWLKSCLCSQIDVCTESTTCRVTGPKILALLQLRPQALKTLVFPNIRTHAANCLASARADCGR